MFTAVLLLGKDSNSQLSSVIDRRGTWNAIRTASAINAAPPTVSAAAYQLILDRRLGEYAIPDGWAIFAAGNRQGDRGVT